MGELLEDPDGCPYPEEVQALADRLRARGDEDILPELVVALEAVAVQNFKLGRMQ